VVVLDPDHPVVFWTWLTIADRARRRRLREVGNEEGVGRREIRARVGHGERAWPSRVERGDHHGPFLFVASIAVDEVDETRFICRNPAEGEGGQRRSIRTPE
jgi:hypothetical protein